MGSWRQSVLIRMPAKMKEDLALHSQYSVIVYLTPERLSDHLFKPQGNRTTIPPKMIIAYIWDIISINYHLRLNS